MPSLSANNISVLFHTIPVLSLCYSVLFPMLALCCAMLFTCAYSLSYSNLLHVPFHIFHHSPVVAPKCCGALCNWNPISQELFNAEIPFLRSPELISCFAMCSEVFYFLQVFLNFPDFPCYLLFSSVNLISTKVILVGNLRWTKRDVLHTHAHL